MISAPASPPHVPTHPPVHPAGNSMTVACRATRRTVRDRSRTSSITDNCFLYARADRPADGRARVGGSTSDAGRVVGRRICYIGRRRTVRDSKFSTMEDVARSAGRTVQWQSPVGSGGRWVGPARRPTARPSVRKRPADRVAVTPMDHDGDVARRVVPRLLTVRNHTGTPLFVDQPLVIPPCLVKLS